MYLSYFSTFLVSFTCFGVLKITKEKNSKLENEKTLEIVTKIQILTKLQNLQVFP